MGPYTTQANATEAAACRAAGPAASASLEVLLLPGLLSARQVHRSASHNHRTAHCPLLLGG